MLASGLKRPETKLDGSNVVGDLLFRFLAWRWSRLENLSVCTYIGRVSQIKILKVLFDQASVSEVLAIDKLCSRTTNSVPLQTLSCKICKLRV